MSQPGDRLEPQLQKALESLKVLPSRDPAAAARGRATFLAQATSLQRAVSPPAARRHKGWINLFSRQSSLAMFATGLLLLCLLLGATGATVYAAQESLPDTPLYHVKLLSEDARTTLAFQPEAKLDLLLGFADRRVDEMGALNLTGATPPAAVTSRLYQQLDEALALAAELSDPRLNQALARVQAKIRRQMQTLMRVQARVPEPAKAVLARVQAMLAERLSLIELGLTDPQTFRQQMRGLGPPITPPGQEHRPPITPPGQQHRPPITPPGLQHRP